jgi:hypothetical protein
MRFSCPQVLITLALLTSSTVGQHLHNLSVIAFPYIVTIADPTDWVNIAYVSKQAQSLGRSSTSDAQNAINQAARLSAKKGPWCTSFNKIHFTACSLLLSSAVTDSKGIAPPSKDSRDYLSWAP